MRLYRLVVIETVYDAEAAHLMYVTTFIILIFKPLAFILKWLFSLIHRSGLSIYYGGIALIVNGLNDKLPVGLYTLTSECCDNVLCACRSLYTH